jgi:hypothetical protein
LALHQFSRFPKVSSLQLQEQTSNARTWLANVATGLVSTVIRFGEPEITSKRRAPILALSRGSNSVHATREWHLKDTIVESEVIKLLIERGGFGTNHIAYFSYDRANIQRLTCGTRFWRWSPVFNAVPTARSPVDARGPASRRHRRDATAGERRSGQAVLEMTQLLGRRTLLIGLGVALLGRLV